MLNLARKIFNLVGAMPSRWSNLHYNRVLWDRYARRWNKATIHIDNTDISDSERESYLQCVGDEWGRKSDVDRIVADYIHPFITEESVVAEIGVGGARIAWRVADRTRDFYCFDVSSEMLKRAEALLSGFSNIGFVLLDKPRLPRELAGTFDFVYAFDVFVHLDLHTMWKYFSEINLMLKVGGKAFIHTSNLKAPAGWRQFAGQDAYTVGGHYPVSPEIIAILAEHSAMEIIKESTVDESNFYLKKDYLVVMEKNLMREL